MNLYDEATKEVKSMWNGNDLTCPKKIIKALERAKKEHELLGLYRLHYRNGMEYNHNGKLIHQIVKLEGELK
jgi:hypothetical protein